MAPPSPLPVALSIIENPESFVSRKPPGKRWPMSFEDEKGRRDVMKRLTKDEARRIRLWSISTSKTEHGRQRTMKRFTRDEARRIAVNVGEAPELLKR